MNTHSLSPERSDQSEVPSEPADLTVILMLARLIDRLDANPAAADPLQYRSVAQSLSHHLSRAAGHPLLNALLDAYPGAAQIYENLNYRHAGLCRSPLEASLSAELQARRVMERASGVIKLSR